MSDTPTAPEAVEKPVAAVVVQKPANSILGYALVALVGIAIGVGALYLLKSPNSTISTISDSVSVDGAKVVVVDAPRLIQAALVAQMLKKQDGLGGDEIGQVVAATVAKYQRNGFLVLAASAAVGYPPSADITQEIASKLRIDLNDAEKGEQLISGEDESLE